MRRFLPSFASLCLLSSAAVAQCPTGNPAGLVPWQPSFGYTSPFPVDDEGITSPPIVLSPAFPMPGAIGSLDRLWVSSNGELYLTDSTLNLPAPVGASSYGITDLAELRGGVGGSARIAVLGGDYEASSAPNSYWSVTVDQASNGDVTVTWFDCARFFNTTDRFSFSCTLRTNGTIECIYGTTFPVDLGGRVVGVSIGNNVGLPTTPPVDLLVPNSSGLVGLMHERFAPGEWDLSGKKLTFSSNGIGGYTSACVQSNAPLCAENTNVCTGCYSFPADNAFHEVFASAPAAKAALDGRSLRLRNTGECYVAEWLTTASFLVPTLPTPLPLVPDGDLTLNTTSIPVPGISGGADRWTVSENGILTAASTTPIENNSLDPTPTAAEMIDAVLAPGVGFYTWYDFDVASGGTIQAGLSGTTLVITWAAVGSVGGGTSTWQYQIDTGTGDVTIVWQSFDPSISTNDVLVGCTLAGPGALPGAVTLGTNLSATLSTVVIEPLTLSVSPRPLLVPAFGPSVPMTYTIGNAPAIVAGTALGALVFSFGAPCTPFDLGVLGAPGCDLCTCSLDVTFALVGVPPTVFWPPNLPLPITAPLLLTAQALFLMPPGSMCGRNTFGLVTSNAVRQYFNFF